MGVRLVDRLQCLVGTRSPCMLCVSTNIPTEGDFTWEASVTSPGNLGILLSGLNSEHRGNQVLARVRVRCRVCRMLAQ